jgi:hypothetical protein
MATRPGSGIVALGLLVLPLSGCLYLGYDSCTCAGHTPGWKMGPVNLTAATPKAEGPTEVEQVGTPPGEGTR